MRCYPIMLDLRGRLAVVVGGGPVGVRKVRSLLDAGASVKLVADILPPDAAELKAAGVIIINKPYCAEFLDGALLVFACTDDRALNAQIAQDSHWTGAIANAADQNEDCDFFVPAMHFDGDVVIAVGTGGASPSLAGSLRDRMAQALPPRVGEFAAALAVLRDELKRLISQVSRRGEIMKQLSSQGAYEEFITGGEQALRRMMSELL